MTAAFNQMLAQGPTPIKFADPVNQMAQLMQLKNYQQTGVVNQMAIDKGQRALDTENAVKALYAGGATPTSNQLSAVSPEAGAAARTAEGVANMQASTIAANNAKTAKLEQQSRNYKITQYGNTLRSLDALPESERNAVYLNMIPHLAENLGPEVAASFPPAYDSKRIAALLGRSKEILDADQQVFDNEIKNRQTAASEMSAAAARDRATNGGAGGVGSEKGSNFQLVQDTSGNWVNVDKRSGLGPNGVPIQGRAPGSPAPLSAVQQQKLNRDKLADRGVIDQLTASLRSMEIPIYGADIPAKTDASGKIIPASKTRGLLSPGFDTSGVEGVMGRLPSLPGGKAAQAESYLQSVSDQMKGVGRSLMTAGSQGKLGNMAVQEWQIAANQVASIDPVKDPDWKFKLEEVVTRMKYNIKLKENQFAELYPDAEPGNASDNKSQSILDEADAIMSGGK